MPDRADHDQEHARAEAERERAHGDQKSPRKGSIRFRDDACSPIISMGRAATAAP
jgi:hypothetical protein